MSTRSRVLVAAGQPALRTRVADAFLHDGHDVATADRIDTALGHLSLQPFAVLVVHELHGPADALRLVEAARAEHPDLVIVAIARGPAELDRIRPLVAGADAVAPSECSHIELRAHIDAVRRRRAGRTPQVLRAGALEVRPAARQVTYRDGPVTLCAKEYALLVALAAEPGRVFTKQELLKSVWGYATEGRTRTLDSHACRLRRKLEEAGARHFVQNIWGVGYRLMDPAPIAAAA